MFFPSYHVKIEKHPMSMEEAIVVTGEIKNDSLKNYTLAMFRIILYNRDFAVAAGVIKIYDFKAGTMKTFYTVVDAHQSLIPSITRHEIILEGGH